MSTRDECESVTPGKYVVRRTIEIGGRKHTHKVECLNPAVGFLKLNAWEELQPVLAEEKPPRKRANFIR